MSRRDQDIEDEFGDLHAGEETRRGGSPPRRSSRPATGASGPRAAVAATGDGLAVVVAGHGRHHLVRYPDGRTLTAVTRGKRGDVAVGDHVVVTATGDGQGVVERVAERRNELKRSEEHRTKRLAANVDRVAIVLAVEPPFSEELLLRVLCDASLAGIEALLVLNKCDLTEPLAAAEPRLRVYEALGYPVLRISARADAPRAHALLSQALAGRTTLLVGQSGMGKSTIVNLLVPDAGLATQEISQALGTGRHTTTFTRMFALPLADARIIDTPGFQTFGLAHLSASELMHAMPEFAPLLGRCRFNNCTHREEPGCAIREAVQAGTVDRRRYELYLAISAGAA